MTTTPTPNRQLIQVTVGSELDTWGPYINQTTSTLDSVLGARTVVACSGSNITLSSAQYAAAYIVFQSTLTANITVTLPAVGSFYIFENVATGSSLFTITLATSVSSGQHIGMPFGWNAIDVVTDGANVKFNSLEPVGTYIDLASTSVPAWITACSVPPYLYCNGSSFSSATYPVLSAMFEGTSSPGHLPDFRGRAKFALDIAGIRGYSSEGSGQLFKAPGGRGIVAVSSTEIPIQVGLQVTAGSVTGGSSYYSIDPQVSGGSNITNLPPLIAAGITLIRAG